VLAPPLVRGAGLPNDVGRVPRETTLKLGPETLGAYSHIGSPDSDDVADHAGPVARSDRERTVEVQIKNRSPLMSHNSIRWYRDGARRRRTRWMPAPTNSDAPATVRKAVPNPLPPSRMRKTP